MPDATDSPTPDTPICSAKGCRADATWSVIWNNPKIHTPDREKVWVACDEHRDTLSEFLRIRSMFIRVDPLES
ncbi:hypothetical protein [Tomitella biformata]|uniref:hypothetical protein n=1 Tax=Tomitella biformata TaxID=630403 RepID=UPI000466CF5E|nr:hypothetical protein [Tomitella biformata]